MKNRNTNEKPHYIGHRKRVKEKFLQFDSKNFQDYEILEILLFLAYPRIDTKILAKEIIKKFGNINNLINSNFDLLKETTEINENSLILIKAIKEIINRSFLQNIENKTVIKDWESLLRYCQIKFFNLKYEEFSVIFLDKKYQIIEDYQHNEGSIDNVQIDIDKIIKRAILLEAKNIILSHNHPSGEVQPSKNDLITTEKLIRSFNAINIKIIDHLIIGPKNQYYSFKENGII